MLCVLLSICSAVACRAGYNKQCAVRALARVPALLPPPYRGPPRFLPALFCLLLVPPPGQTYADLVAEVAKAKAMTAPPLANTDLPPATDLPQQQSGRGGESSDRRMSGIAPGYDGKGSGVGSGQGREGKGEVEFNGEAQPSLGPSDGVSGRGAGGQNWGVSPGRPPTEEAARMEGLEHSNKRSLGQFRRADGVGGVVGGIDVATSARPAARDRMLPPGGGDGSVERGRSAGGHARATQETKTDSLLGPLFAGAGAAGGGFQRVRAGNRYAVSGSFAVLGDNLVGCLWVHVRCWLSGTVRGY